MTIKESKNVDSQGKVYVLYLENWKNTNDLLCLIQVMIITFSETPPVYKKPEANLQQSASNSSMNRAGFPPSMFSLNSIFLKLNIHSIFIIILNSFISE